MVSGTQLGHITLRAQPVDATPSGINLLFKGGVYGTRETCGVFCGAKDRHMAPLEDGAIVAYDWARIWQATYVHSLSVVALRWDCSGSPSALAASTHTGRARGHLAGDRLRFVDS